jgi:hypothetical protein
VPAGRGIPGGNLGEIPARNRAAIPNGNGKDKCVFVLALAKSFIESGRVVDASPDGLVRVIEDLRTVYRRTFGQA